MIDLENQNNLELIPIDERLLYTLFDHKLVWNKTIFGFETTFNNLNVSLSSSTKYSGGDDSDGDDSLYKMYTGKVTSFNEYKVAVGTKPGQRSHEGIEIKTGEARVVNTLLSELYSFVENNFHIENVKAILLKLENK